MEQVISSKTNYMTTHSDEVLKRIKSTYNNEVGERRNLKVPGDMEFAIVGDNVVLSITADAVCQNMQSDKASFEGWALVLKRWGNFTKVILLWDKPSYQPGSPEEGHYQRFLFRVNSFSEHFKSWFAIDSSCMPLMSMMKAKGQGPFFLNKPSTNRNDKIPQTKEGLLENKFVKGEFRQPLMDFSKAKILDRQLPVGVFIDRVSAKTAIFSRGKSAIDIWGISKDNELLIFELKAEQNDKVGIISEIYFYANVMRMVMKQIWAYETPCDSNLLAISKASKIIVNILAPSVHPLIDMKLIEELNCSTKPEIEIHYIKFDLSSSTLLNLEF